ncbi:prepro-urotensin II-beta-like, partial [Clarias magur]
MSSDGKADNTAVLRTEARFKQHWDKKDTEGVSSTEVMLGKAVLACALLLMVLEPLLTLPITQLADMSYTGP